MTTPEPRKSSAAGYVIKLVRDGYLGRDAAGVRFERLEDRDEHVRLLRQKLLEEVGEYLADPTLGELADVYGVLIALTTVAHDRLYVDLFTQADEKDKARGGFLQGIVMVGEVLPDA